MEGIENSDVKQRKVVYLDMTGDNLGVVDDGVRRDVTSEQETREIARQMAGHAPSEGAPQYAMPEDSPEPPPATPPAELGDDVETPPPSDAPAAVEAGAVSGRGAGEEVPARTHRNRSKVYALTNQGAVFEGEEEDIPLPTNVEEDASWERVSPRGAHTSESVSDTERSASHGSPEHTEQHERIHPDTPGRITGLGAHVERPASEQPIGLGEFRREDYAGIKPLAIPEIMGNAEYQTFWGNFIDAVNPGKGREIITKAATTGALSAEERMFIDHAQHEFTKVIKNWEELKKGITPQLVKSHLMQRDNTLRGLVDLAGEDRLVATFQAHYMRDAIKTLGTQAGRDKFHGYAQHLRTIHEMSEKPVYKEYDTKIRALCKQFNIDVSDPEHETLLEKYLGFALPKDKRSARGNEAIQELREKYREDAGMFERVRDTVFAHVPFANRGTPKKMATNEYNEAVELYRAKTRGEVLGHLSGKPLREINRSLNAVTVFLADTISPHADELTRLAFRGEPVRQPAFLPTVQDVFERGAFTQENIQKNFNAARDKATITKDGATKRWQAFTDTEKAEFRDNWIENQKQDTLHSLKGSNWFVELLFKLLLGSKLAERARGLQLDNPQQQNRPQQNRGRE